MKFVKSESGGRALRNEFAEAGRDANWSLHGCEALFSYYEENHPDYECDPVGLDCEWAEMTQSEMLHQYLDDEIRDMLIDVADCSIIEALLPKVTAAYVRGVLGGLLEDVPKELHPSDEDHELLDGERLAAADDALNSCACSEHLVAELMLVLDDDEIAELIVEDDDKVIPNKLRDKTTVLDTSHSDTFVVGTSF